MSLKQNLYDTIKNLNGEVLTLDEFEDLCKRKGRKISNGERRMRDLIINTCIEPIRNKKNYIIGYRWKEARFAPQRELGFNL